MWQLLPSSFLVFPLKNIVICIIIPIPFDLINGFEAWFASLKPRANGRNIVGC